MKNLAESYRTRYYISPKDLADAAETNRLHTIVVSSLLFFFGILDFLAVILLIFTSGMNGKYIFSLVYFGIFTLYGIFGVLYSIKIKNVEREKAYFYKTVPFYLVLLIGVGAAVYNFYVLGQPFNGVITFSLAGFLALCTFSFSPVPFSIILFAGMAAMVPGIYRNFKMSGLADSILAMVLMMVIAFYKRRVEKKFVAMLNKQKKNLEAKTFGNFTLLYDNKVIKFARSKSSELIAYLICKNGSSVKTKELISVLWGDHADSSRYGANFRNLVVDIRHSLSELEIQNFFISEYNNFRINPEAIHCDYYDFLNGDKQAEKNFTGEFMSQYSWAEDVTGFLERKILK